MTLRALKRTHQATRETEKLQENISEFLGAFDYSLLSGEFLTEINDEGVETEMVEIPNSEKTFSHRLGRNYKGFIVVESTQNSNFKNIRSSEVVNQRSADELFITLEASTSTLAKVWVF